MPRKPIAKPAKKAARKPARPAAKKREGKIIGVPASATSAPQSPPTTAAKQARALAAAALALRGAKTGEIAGQLGVGRTQAWRILRSAEVQQIVITFVNAQFEVLHSLFLGSLVAIEEALSADRPDVVTREGVVIPESGGPDHYARLAAVGKLVQLMTAGRPKITPEPERSRPGMTLTEVKSRVTGPTSDHPSDPTPSEPSAARGRQS